MHSIFYFASCDEHYARKIGRLRQFCPTISHVNATHYGAALKAISSSLFTAEKFFIIDDDETLLDEKLIFETPAEADKLHVWSTDNPDKFAGVKFITKTIAGSVDFSKELRFEALKDLPTVWHEEHASRYQLPPTDIIFLAYDEPNASANLEILERRFGNRVKVVKGVTGIDKAFTACADASSTGWFYIVNADSQVVPTFDFSFYPAVGERHLQHVWMTQNELIPDLIYGYGGIKLFHKKFFKGAKFNKLDFTTHLVPQKYHDEVASVMQVTSEKQAFRAAFRESAKLQFQGDEESLRRLEKWLSVGRNTKLQAATLAGAALGKELAKTYVEADLFQVINNFSALDAYFKQAQLWWRHVSA